MSSVCSIDTCFLIDWARYSRRHILEKLFEFCYVTDEVLREIVSETTLQYVAQLLGKGFLVLYPFKETLEPIVRRLIEVSARDPRIRTLDPPEAYALAIGLRENAVVLTENRGVHTLVKLYAEYSNVKVWRSYELLVEAYRRGLVENLEEELARYERETGHRFPRRSRGGVDRARNP